MRGTTWLGIVGSIVIAVGLSGCVGGLDGDLGFASVDEAADEPVILPQTDFYDTQGNPGYHAAEEPEPFHTWDEIEEKIERFEDEHPDLVQVDVIGESWEGRPIYDIIVTNKDTPGPKPAPFFDGGHHANELAGTEIALYTVDFLLDNYERNATVQAWVDNLEIHLVPIVNPDGYIEQTRGNALGVNLNRNYDVDWGNPGGASNALMGTLAHATDQPMPSVSIVAENSGPHAFSEPESIALRDALMELDEDLAFYMTYHTPTNGMIAPWAAFEHPFTIPQEQDDVLWSVLDWVRGNTEYKAGKAQWGDFSAGLPYSASGSSMDWAYMRHNVPSFTLELEIWYTSIFSDDYPERVYLEPYKGLEYWLEASLPIPLHLLANAHELAQWENADNTPPLPEGVPPDRPDELDDCEGIPHDEAPHRPKVPLSLCEIVSQPGDHDQH